MVSGKREYFSSIKGYVVWGEIKYFSNIKQYSDMRGKWNTLEILNGTWYGGGGWGRNTLAILNGTVAYGRVEWLIYFSNIKQHSGMGKTEIL